MFALKCILLFTTCLVFFATASPIDLEDVDTARGVQLEQYNPLPLARVARSPQGGSVQIEYGKDQRGREASVQYNHNLYSSRDGRGSVDAYAQGSRNFDQNRNNFGGGIQGKWRF